MIPWGIAATVLLKLVDLILDRSLKEKHKEITEKQVEKFFEKHGDRYNLVKKESHGQKDGKTP